MSRMFLGRSSVCGLSTLMLPGSLRAQADEKKPVVVLDTSMGKITIELDKEKAPITVENFLKYVDAGFYDNLIFHRVIENFMIQGGGFDAKMKEKTEGQRGDDQERVRQRFEQCYGHDCDGPDDQPEFGPEPVLHQHRGQRKARTLDQAVTLSSARSSTAWTWSTRSKRCLPRPARHRMAIRTTCSR